ncbi:hypothetical protein MKW94_014399 [Papaver nudicaule]|uniref:Uncharacterized protein n=1 Tax=Papaver nudicaule TaxID=74823 RepID=A0AA41VIZ5_PAPNU|nr:hypothetical protein [Papaver nudicaule]
MAKFLLHSTFISLSFLVLLIISCSSSAARSIQNPDNFIPTSAHKELQTNGFPIGLLPKNVLNYSLNKTSGDFSVNLGYTCKLTLPPDNYLATYSKKITGKLVEGKIGELKGIRVWAFFQWWSITGIKSSGENLVFEVGMVSAKYPAKNFDESPECQGNHSSY